MLVRQSQGRAWRVLGIEDKMLMLDSFGEQWQIDLGKAKWEKYCETPRLRFLRLRNEVQNHPLGSRVRPDRQGA